MTFVALVLVWGMVLGLSPGLALIAIPITVLAIDRFDPAILDRLWRRLPG